MYTYKQNQNSPAKIKYNRLTQKTKESESYIYLLITKLTKAQIGKKKKKTKNLKQGVNWE